MFYLHRYLFEKHIKKQLSLKEEGDNDLKNDHKHLKVRYSIESYEKMLVTVEKMHNRHEEMSRSHELVLKRLMTLEKDRLNEDSREKVA